LIFLIILIQMIQMIKKVKKITMEAKTKDTFKSILRFPKRSQNHPTIISTASVRVCDMEISIKMRPENNWQMESCKSKHH